MRNIKIALMAVVAGVVLVGSMPASAMEATSTPAIKDAIKEKREELKKEIKEKQKEFKEEVKDLRHKLNDQIKEKRQELNNQIKEMKKHVRRQVTVRGELMEIKGTTVPTELVVKVKRVIPKKNKNWEVVYPEAEKVITVKIDAKTKIVRRFNGKSSLAEYAPGDLLDVIGRVNENGTIAASLVRNESIQATWRVHNGIVESIDVAAKSLVVLQPNGVKMTVKTDAQTKILLNGAAAGFADLKTGDKVHVRGILNTRTKTVAAVLIRINRPLVVPPVVPPTPTSTPSVTPTTTPSGTTTTTTSTAS